jgi:leucyl/phenylalanyl-tRNA--protein transferase
MITDHLTDGASAYGLVAVGGDLSPDRLLWAYSEGIFPWYDDSMPICWWSPDPRAIFELEQFRPSRRLQRTHRSGRFRLTINRAFASVIRGCAYRPGEGTWITPDMIAAYEQLHRMGYAHSIEAWQDGELAGGLYGVALGGLFAGESMFYLRRDASKVALLHLVKRLRECGFALFDTQFLTEHTARLGATEIPRQEYLRRLRAALARNVSFV